MQCLIQALRGAVNNPSLPILETMQQYTLDAITASGNTSLTESQRFALNHFFYALGKFDTLPGRIWDKLDYIALPMLAGSLSNAFVDYKDNTDRFYNKDVNLGRCELVDNGVSLTSAAGNIFALVMKKASNSGISAGNFSFFSAYSVEGEKNSSGAVVYDGSTEIFRQEGGVGYAEASITELGGVFVIAPYAAPIVSVRADIPNEKWSVISIKDDDVVYNTTSYRSENYGAHEYSEKYSGVRLVRKSWCSGLQASIAGEYLSDDEALVVLNAINDLRNALLQ